MSRGRRKLERLSVSLCYNNIQKIQNIHIHGIRGRIGPRCLHLGQHFFLVEYPLISSVNLLLCRCHKQGKCVQECLYLSTMPWGKHSQINQSGVHTGWHIAHGEGKCRVLHQKQKVEHPQYLWRQRVESPQCLWGKLCLLSAQMVSRQSPASGWEEQKVEVCVASASAEMLSGQAWALYFWGAWQVWSLQGGILMLVDRSVRA